MNSTYQDNITRTPETRSSNTTRSACACTLVIVHPLTYAAPYYHLVLGNVSRHFRDYNKCRDLLTCYASPPHVWCNLIMISDMEVTMA